jgi:hypothetical protein
MITIRTKTYENINGYDVVFKRIRIDVEPVRRLVISQFGNTVDTNKPFVGEVDDGDGTFKLIKTNPSSFFRFIDGNFFNLIAEGEVLREGQKARIGVRYKIEWQTAVYFMFTLAFPLIFSIQFVIDGESEDLNLLIGWFLTLGLVPFVLLIVQVNSIEKEISNVLGAEK